MPDPKQPPSSRAVLAAWIRTQTEGQDEVHIPLLAKSAVEHFSGDAKFLRHLAAEALPDMVYEIARTVLGRTRYIDTGDTLVTRATLRSRAVSRWATWLEHAGDRHVRLMAMTRTDLELASEERRQRGMAELGLAHLFSKLAGRLEGGQVVADVFTLEEIEAIHAELQAE